MVLSIAVAIGLWLYVVSNVGQQNDLTFYNIPVVREGESVLNERNLMVTSVSANAVSLHLSGARDDLNKVDSSNMIVKLDLSKITEPGEKIPMNYIPSYPTDVASNAFEVTNKNPATIFVTVDYRRTFEIPVRIKWTGTRSENYIYDTENAVLDYPTITITGPAAVADRIDHAQITVDLSEQVESISESFRYTLCDVDGNAVDAQYIATNVEEVRLNVQIQQIKEMNLMVDLMYGGGANESNTTVKITPEIIRVSGGEAVLAELGDIYMSENPEVKILNLADLEKNSNELKYTLNLPEGVTNQTGVSEVVVSIRFTGLKTKEFVIDNFEMTNVPEGMKAEIINASLTVKLRGPEEEISKLSEKDITARVDFAEAEVGTATYSPVGSGKCLLR